MTTQAHIDFEVIGERTLTASDPLGGTDWIGTGITVPMENIEALVAQVGPFRTAVFRASRLTNLDPTTLPGVATDASARLPLSEIGVSGLLAGTAFLGITADAELLASYLQFRPGQIVRLYHLVPADVGIDDLNGEALSRLLPDPTPDQALYRVVVNAAGDGYTLLPPGATPDIPSDRSVVYATLSQYRSRTGASDRVDDDLLLEQLTAASRLVDQELRVVAGHFAPHTATYRFSSSSGSVLYLRDEDGLAYGLRDVVAGGIRPDYDRTGRYDQYAWDLDDPWMWPRARNAVAQGRPYYALELRRLGDVPITIWPWTDGSVQIEGSWGWPSTPAPIRELVIKVARDMRDSLRGGAAARVEVVDDGAVYRPDTWRLWNEIKVRYGRRPAMAR